MLITSVLDEMVARHPDKEAIVCGPDRITYCQLKEQVNNLAGNLALLGVKPGDRVAILLPNCVDYASSFIAPLQIGAISVPLNPRYTQQEVAEVFRDCTPNILITTYDRIHEFQPMMNTYEGFRALIFNEDPAIPDSTLVKSNSTKLKSLQQMLTKIPDIVTNVSVGSDDHAAYLYTSGTTGRSKGVIITHETIAVRGPNTRNLTITSEDKIYTVGGLYHNAKLFIGLVTSLYLGMTFFTDIEFHPQQAVDRLLTERITYFHASPFHFGILAHWEGFRELPHLPALRICLSSGNKLSKSISIPFQNRFGVAIHQNYGITEAGGLCTDGLPLPGVEIKVLDDSGNELSTNQIGEIVVRGRELATGYLNRPELTAGRFRNGWYFTGDLGFIDEESRLHLRHRKKHTMMIDSREIYPDEIQDILNDHPYVEDAMIKKSEDNQLIAIVVTAGSVTASELIAYCREHLPSHLIPDRIDICDDLPYNWKVAINSGNFNIHY